MKKIFLMALGAMFMFSCNKENEGYQINGTIDSIVDGEKVFIEILSETGEATAIDTAVVKGGKFELIGKATETDLAFIQIGTLNGKIPFILENQKIQIKAYKDSLQASEVSGSYNNEELVKFNKEFGNLQKKIMKFRTDNQSAFMTAQMSNDTVVINKLNLEHSNLEKEVRGYMENYASENPKSFVSLLLLSQSINNPSIDFEKTKASFESLIPELKTSKKGKVIEEKIKELSATSIGQKAPDFSATNPEGQMVSLKESLGKVTIIDFWASWCGPCRVENPHVVALYNEFHEKGLNIIGVSLDREDQKDKWLEAIATDKLTWTQVSNLKFWQDPIAKQYNVTSIPATFILDATGTIVAKNLRGEELKNKVVELLEK